MSDGARDRRLARRAAEREEVARKVSENRNFACIECGRGEINTSLLPPPLDTVDTSLALVACTTPEAHVPPSGRHIGRCSGFVYRHRNAKLCAAVKAAAARPKLIAAGGN